MGLRDPRYTLWHFWVGGPKATSYELRTAIIGPYTTSEKCFNTPIENALCRCQFGVKWGKKNRRYPYWILTPQRKGSFVSGSRCLSHVSSKSVKNCDRESADRQTHTRTDWQRWQGWSYNLSMLSFSNGTDKLPLFFRTQCMYHAVGLYDVRWHVSLQ